MREWVRCPKIRERLRYDPQLSIELTLCHEWGIPHSQFLRWSAVDRAKAIAFFYEKSARCVMCGTAQWEWDEDPNAYQATTEFCPGCYRKDAAHDTDEALPPGASITLISTKSPEWQQMLAENEAEFRAEQAARVRAKKGLSDE